MIKLGRAAGLEIMPAPTGQKIRIGRRNARASETEDFLAALVKANRAIDEASRGKVDVSCASVMPKELGDWAGTAEFVLGANFAGKDLKDVSADRQGPRPGPQFRDRLPAGTGHAGRKTRRAAAVVAVDAGEPHRMGQPRRHRANAGRQDHGARRHHHRVDQCAGRGQHQVRARYPEAHARCGGEAEARQLRSHRAAAAGQSARARARRHRDRAEQFDAHGAAAMPISGSSSLCSIDVGGSFGRDLSAQGEAAMVAFAIEWLTKMFGSDVAKAVKKSSATRWNAAPYVLGAMSVGRARRAAVAQESLSEPLGCMYFAGEATHETLWGTVDGAWESGERAAEAALRRIGALRDEPAGKRRSSSGGSRASRRARRCRGPRSMMPRPKALISWSSGKDSAFALHEVRRAGEFEVVGALTTVTETFGRVSIHGVRQEILRAQCEAAGLAAADRADPVSLPERDLRGADGRGGRERGARRHHPHDLRRSVPRRYPRLSRSRSSPAPASRRCFRCGSGRRRRWRRR